MEILRHEAGHVVQHAYQLSPPPPLAATVRPDVTALSALLSAQSRQPAITSSICGCGTRKAIPTRISPKHSRCGCGRARTGARAISAGRRSRSSRYVDELMAGDRRQASAAPPSRKWSIRSASSRRRSANITGRSGSSICVDPPKTYDRDLRRLFSADPKHRRSETAASFIRRNRARVRELVSKWTGEYQLTFDAGAR